MPLKVVTHKLPQPEPEVKKATPVKTPAKEPAAGAPPAKVAKVETPKPADEANKENGEPEKTVREISILRGVPGWQMTPLALLKFYVPDRLWRCGLSD